MKKTTYDVDGIYDNSFQVKEILKDLIKRVEEREYDSEQQKLFLQEVKTVLDNSTHANISEMMDEVELCRKDIESMDARCDHIYRDQCVIDGNFDKRIEKLEKMIYEMNRVWKDNPYE